MHFCRLNSCIGSSSSLHPLDSLDICLRTTIFGTNFGCNDAKKRGTTHSWLGQKVRRSPFYSSFELKLFYRWKALGLLKLWRFFLDTLQLINSTVSLCCQINAHSTNFLVVPFLPSLWWCLIDSIIHSVSHPAFIHHCFVVCCCRWSFHFLSSREDKKQLFFLLMNIRKTPLSLLKTTTSKTTTCRLF